MPALPGNDHFPTPAGRGSSTASTRTYPTASCGTRSLPHANPSPRTASACNSCRSGDSPADRDPSAARWRDKTAEGRPIDSQKTIQRDHPSD
ncbi:MAG: hypothetical protein N2A42_11905, partial [Luteolibacter sp.]